MSRRPRCNHSPAFKAKVAPDAIRGEKTLAEQQDAPPKPITDWKNQFLEQASGMFDAVTSDRRIFSTMRGNSHEDEVSRLNETSSPSGGLNELLGRARRKYALKFLKDDGHIRLRIAADLQKLVMVVIPMRLTPPSKRTVPLTFNPCMSLSDLVERQDLHISRADDADRLAAPIRHDVQIAHARQGLIASVERPQ